MPNCKQAIQTKHKMMHACETKQFKSKEPASPPWPSLETGTTSAKSHNQELLDLMAALTIPSFWDILDITYLATVWGQQSALTHGLGL